MSTATIHVEVNDETDDVVLAIVGEGRAQHVAERMMQVASAYFAKDGRVQREEVTPS